MKYGRSVITMALDGPEALCLCRAQGKAVARSEGRKVVESTTAGLQARTSLSPIRKED